MNKYKFMSVEEVAEKLMSNERGVPVDFTFDDEYMTQEPTGWYGVKIIDLFDETNGCLAFGIYGGGMNRVEEIIPSDESVTVKLQRFLNDEVGYEVKKICVDVSEN